MPVLHIVYANDLVGDGVAQLIDETVRPDQRRIPHCQGGGLLHLELHGGKDLRAVGIDPFAVSPPLPGTAREAQYDLCVNYLVLDGWEHRDLAVGTVSDNPAFRRRLGHNPAFQPPGTPHHPFFIRLGGGVSHEYAAAEGQYRQNCAIQGRCCPEVQPGLGRHYDNDTIPTAENKIPMILGDLKEGVAYWDRRTFSVKVFDQATWPPPPPWQSPGAGPAF